MPLVCVQRHRLPHVNDMFLQAKCPLYVHQRIWRHHRSRTRELVQGDDETARYLLGPDAAAATESEDLTGTKMFTTIRWSTKDLMLCKL